MEVNSIKFWRDGERFIIVVDNCTGSTATKVNNFITDMLGLTPQEQPAATPVPHITPQKPPSFKADEVLAAATPIKATTDLFREIVDPHDIIIEGGAGTLGHAIESKDTAAVVRFFAEHKEHAPAQKLCRQYILDDCNRRDYVFATESEIRVFFSAYQPIIKDAVPQILSSAGYATIEDFFDFADICLIRDAYRAILESILTT